MWTAKHNFSHVIASNRRSEHELVTHGVYKYVVQNWCSCFCSAATASFSRGAHRECAAASPTRFIRHPSYCGWFWWSVGTQVLLGNPACTVLYAAAAWQFFRHRIPYEEATLESFFGEQYRAYMARTIVGVPFVKGVAEAQEG